MQPSLIVVGLSYPGSPVSVRERFWLDTPGRASALAQLRARNGIEEVAILANTDRTEFIIWASDLSLAASSVLTYLTGKHDLRLCEWKNFYRLVDETALLHLLRVGSGLESRFSAQAEVMDDLRSALAVGHAAGTAGARLQMAFDSILQVAARTRQQTGIGFPRNFLLSAAVEVATSQTGDLHPNVLIITSGSGDRPESVVVRNLNRAAGTDVAHEAGGESISLEQCWREMAEVDMVVHLSSGPAFAISAEEATEIAARRKDKPLRVFDLAVPRKIQPALASTPGFILCDIDELHQHWEAIHPQQRHADDRVQQLLAREAKAVLSRLQAVAAPPAAAVRYGRIKELCREVAHNYTVEVAASEEQAQAIEGVSKRIASRIASYLGAEEDARRRPTLLSTVRRLFHAEGRQAVARPKN